MRIRNKVTLHNIINLDYQLALSNTPRNNIALTKL